jgi:hypothetical protein
VRGAAVLVLAFGVSLLAQPTPTYKSGAEFYLAYRAAFTKARSLDELLPWMARARRDEIARSSPSERREGFRLMKMFDDHINFRVLKETPSATGARLQVEAITAAEKAKETGVITLVREAGAWKIGEESWTAAAK